MSQENVEIVRRIVEDAVQGRWEESARQLGPDAEMHGTVGGLTEGSVWRGSEEIRKVFEQEDAEACEERRLEAEEFIEVHNGRVVRLQGYMDRAEALEAAGLSG